MSIEFPAPIAAYFAADRNRDPHELAACFTREATVVDEGNTYDGRDAIRDWMAQASTKYTYTAEPFALVEEGKFTVVTSRLVGNFPGSPVDLRYRFVLDGNRIARLEIVS